MESAITRLSELAVGGPDVVAGDVVAGDVDAAGGHDVTTDADAETYAGHVWVEGDAAAAGNVAVVTVDPRKTFIVGAAIVAAAAAARIADASRERNMASYATVVATFTDVAVVAAVAACAVSDLVLDAIHTSQC